MHTACAKTPTLLPLTQALRDALDLGANDALRVLSRGSRTVALEIERITETPGETPGALGDARPLALCADVRAFSLADVLQLVHLPGKSGLLHFEHGSIEKRVYLHIGEVVFARSNQRVDRLGECLVRLGLIEREQLEASRAAQLERPDAPIGRLLVERNALSPQQLWEGVKAQVEEIVRSLFAFGAGTVLFFEGEVRPDNVVRLSLPTQKLVEEGLGERERLLEFLAFLEDPGIQLVAEPSRGERLDGAERDIARAASTPVHFSEMCQVADIDPLSAARIVRLMDEMGAIRLAREAVPSEQDVSIAKDDEVRAAVSAHLKLIAELAAPVVAVEGGEGLRERLGQVAQDAAGRHPELLRDVAMGPGGVLDPEPLIERALRYSGDREREVCMALGELVAYLEFELVNHPGVEDAEAFLGALEPLRSQL